MPIVDTDSGSGPRIRKVSRRTVSACPAEHECLLVEGAPREIEGALQHLLTLRRRRPWAPLTLEFRAGTDHTMERSIPLLEQLSVRFLVDGDLRGRIPHVSNRTTRLPYHLAKWLGTLRPDLKRKPLQYVHALISQGMRGGGVAGAADAQHTCARNMQKVLNRNRLPEPGKFVMFGRLAPGLCQMARDSSFTIFQAAELGQYHDAAAFSRASTRLLGVRPSFARTGLGWEWIAHRAGLAGVRC